LMANTPVERQLKPILIDERREQYLTLRPGAFGSARIATE